MRQTNPHTPRPAKLPNGSGAGIPAPNPPGAAYPIAGPLRTANTRFQAEGHPREDHTPARQGQEKTARQQAHPPGGCGRQVPVRPARQNCQMGPGPAFPQQTPQGGFGGKPGGQTPAGMSLWQIWQVSPPGGYPGHYPATTLPLLRTFRAYGGKIPSPARPYGAQQRCNAQCSDTRRMMATANPTQGLSWPPPRRFCALFAPMAAKRHCLRAPYGTQQQCNVRKYPP